MESIKTLYHQVTQLRQLIDKDRYEVDHATQDSFNCSVKEDYSRATDEAAHAKRLVHEICISEEKVIAIEQQLVEAEHNTLRLLQQEAMLRDDNLNHIAHIDHATKQKLDDIARQIKALRG